MRDLLDLPEVRARMARLSVEEYHLLPEENARRRSTELIRGLILEKPAKSPQRCYVAHQVERALRVALPTGFSLRQSHPLTFQDSEPEPDFAVVAEGDYRSAHPSHAELVVQMVEASPDLERLNASIYAEAGVKEYWIVLPRTETVEVYRHPENGVYAQPRTYSRGETLECQSLPGVAVNLEELFGG